jgi:death-on-curing protein
MLKAHGGLDGVREMGLFESAVDQARATYYYGNESLFDAASAYLFHIAENQPFVDGNKRTAAASALIFLRLNGIALVYHEMFPYELCIAVAEKRLTKEGVAKAFELGRME